MPSSHNQSISPSFEHPPAQPQRVQAILNFWFGQPNSDISGHYRKEWFVKSDAFDRQICQLFLSDIEAAANGKYDHWQRDAHSATALLILLDQFPRNVYRGTPQSFATDSKAIGVAERMVGTGIDRALPPAYRFFIYVPFEHQEAIAYQNQAVALMTRLVTENPNIDAGLKGGLTYAIRHREVIERFGRFPHRNDILGRESTDEERMFLAQPGSRF